MGVVNTAEVDEGQAFGPIPMTMTLAEPAVLIGHRTCDTPPDIHSVKLDINAYNEGVSLAEWVPYVQAAREHGEQNMEAFLDPSGELFFKTIRSLAPGSELFIWYSNDYAIHLGVPPILPSYIKGSSYLCPYCADSFIYPNSLRAHLRFRCKYRHHAIMAQKASVVASAPLNCVVSTASPKSRMQSSRAESPSKASPPQYQTPESPHSSNAGSTSPCPTPEVSIKRSHEDTTIQSSPKRQACVSPQSDVSDSTDKLSPSLPCTDEARSAFQRVDRRKKLSPEPHPPKMPSNPIMTPHLAHDANHIPMHPYHVLASQRLPMAMMGGKLHDMRTFRENKDAEMVKQFNNNNIHAGAKMPYPPQELNALPQGVPYVYRSPNPMVDRMLNVIPRPPVAPSLSLVQNWCAKCNASFRMTSDLVYHMRSHHKREFDPAKKKRDDKLRCEVCGETFRERHHLTRHMTSHA